MRDLLRPEACHGDRIAAIFSSSAPFRAAPSLPQAPHRRLRSLRRRSEASASTPPISASTPAAPKTRAACCRTPSMLPPARALRWRSGPELTGPAISSCRLAQDSRRARRDPDRPDRRSLAHGRRACRPHHAVGPQASTAASARSATAAASSSSKAAMRCGSSIASWSPAAELRHPLDRGATARRAAPRSPTSPTPPSFPPIAAGLLLGPQHHRGGGQQRHPDQRSATSPATTAPWCYGQPHREHRQPLRRLRPVRQRHQRVPRRQRDRAGQSHPALRLFRRARQCRLQHPDRGQQHQRRRRSRALFGVRLRGRGHCPQYCRWRPHRGLGRQFQRGRPPCGRPGQPHPQLDSRSVRPAPTRATAPASASRSRPTRW